MKTNLVIAVIVSLLAGAAGGYALRPASQVSAEALEQARLQGVGEGRAQAMNEINQKFVEKGLSYPAEQEVKEVYGFVKEVLPDGFVLEYQTGQFSVLQDGMTTKKVVLAAGGVIEKIVDAEEGDAAPTPTLPGSAAGGGTPVTGAAPPSAGTDAPPEGPGEGAPAGGSLGTIQGPLPPEPSGALGAPLGQTVVTARLADLREGDYVRVVSATDVQAAATIEATSVTVFNLSHLPPGATPDASQLPFTRLINNPPPVVPSNGPMPPPPQP